MAPNTTNSDGLSGGYREISLDRNTATETQTLKSSRGGARKPVGNPRRPTKNSEKPQKLKDPAPT